MCRSVPAGSSCAGTETPQDSGVAPALVSGGFLQSYRVIKVHRCNSDVPVSLSQDSGNYVTKSTFQAYVFELTFW